MDRKKIGLQALIDIIGKEFCQNNKDKACFSYYKNEEEMFCFLGFTFKTQKNICLSATIDEWDVYASCYVKIDGEVVMDKCKLPN